MTHDDTQASSTASSSSAAAAASSASDTDRSRKRRGAELLDSVSLGEGRRVSSAPPSQAGTAQSPEDLGVALQHGRHKRRRIQRDAHASDDDDDDDDEGDIELVALDLEGGAMGAPDDDDDDDDVNENASVASDEEHEAQVSYREQYGDDEEELYNGVVGTPEQQQTWNEHLQRFTDEQWKAVVEGIVVDNPRREGPADRFAVQRLRFLFHLFRTCRTYMDYMRRASMLFGDFADMEAKRGTVLSVIQDIRSVLKHEGLMNDESRVGKILGEMFTDTSQALMNAYQTMVSVHIGMSIGDTSRLAQARSLDPYSFFMHAGEEKLSPIQMLGRKYMLQMWNQKLCKLGDMLFKRVVKNGHFVFAYEPYKNVHDFIIDNLYPIAEHAGEFAIITKNQKNLAHIEHILTTFNTEYCPSLVQNTDIFAFRNGLYVLPEKKFYFLDHLGRQPSVSDMPDDQCKIAVNYFDMDYRYDEIQRERRYVDDDGKLQSDHYGNIEMETDTILLQQGYSGKDADYVYAMLGRMLRKLSDNNWQVFPMFKGRAGTGKSTLLQLVASMFLPQKVGILNNSVEKNFPLMGLIHTWMYLMLDIDDRFTLDLSMFQSMISGEEVTIHRKNEAPITIRMDQPGAAACNIVPNFTRNPGAMRRRLIFILFETVIQNPDPNLLRRCKNDVDKFLTVINEAYLDLRDRCRASGKSAGHPDIMPERIYELQNTVWSETDPLMTFVYEQCRFATPEEIREDCYIPRKDFKDRFKAYCDSSQIEKRHIPKLTNNALSEKLEPVGVTIEKVGIEYRLVGMVWNDFE